MTAWQKAQSLTASCIYYFVADCRADCCFVSPFMSLWKWFDTAPKLCFLKKDLFFMISVFDGVASSALIVTNLWTKVAPLLKLGHGIWYSSVGRPSKPSCWRLCNEELAWLRECAESFAVVSCARSVKYLQVSQMQIPEDVRGRRRRKSLP